MQTCSWCMSGCCRRLLSASASGNTGSSASTRSSTPPCPGSRPLLSFAPALRLTSDSTRSPTTLIAERNSSASSAERMPSRSNSRPKRLCESTPRRGSIERAPGEREQQHAGHAAPHALPALARADRRRQLAPAERPAAEVGRDVGHPYEAEHREQEVDAERPRMAQRQPGQHQREHARRSGATPAPWRDQPAGPWRDRPGAAEDPHQRGQPPQQAPAARRASRPPSRRRHSATTADADAPAPADRPVRSGAPHSQPAAPISASVSSANGQAAAANSAGSSRASRTRAVMTRCLSMVSGPPGPRPSVQAGRRAPRRSGGRAARRRPAPRRVRRRRSRATGSRVK